MTRFAEVTDLQARTKVVYAGADIPWVEALLDDASAHLRDMLGWQVFPAAQVTYVTKVWAGIFNRLPVQPVVSLDSVSIPDTYMTFDVYDGGFETDTNGIATITFTAGYAAAPASLVSWCCVLAAQVMDTISKLGMLSNGGLSSVAIDDFKAVWAQSSETGGGYTLPASVVAQLRAAWGTTAYVTGSA